MNQTNVANKVQSVRQAGVTEAETQRKAVGIGGWSPPLWEAHDPEDTHEPCGSLCAQSRLWSY